MKIISLFCSILFAAPVFAQPSLNSIKTELTGQANKRWIFEKLKKTMGEKFDVSSECIYARIIFSASGMAYQADRCADQKIEKGNWVLAQPDALSFTLKLDKVYLLNFYTKKINKKDRHYMRLKIQGQDMQQVSLEYIYYAE